MKTRDGVKNAVDKESNNWPLNNCVSRAVKKGVSIIALKLTIAVKPFLERETISTLLHKNILEHIWCRLTYWMNMVT